MLSLIPFPYRILALIALALSLLGFGWMKGAQHGERKLDAYIAKQNVAVLAQVNKAARTSADLRTDSQALEEVKNAQLAAVQHRLDAALVVLRERPERRAVDPGNPRACAGANGSELSMPDGSFLVGIIADTARLQAERNHCISEYNKVRDTLNKMRDEAVKAAK